MSRLVGRPIKLTPKVVDAICDAIEAGANYADAAAVAGICNATLCSWRDSGQELYERVQASEEPIELTQNEKKLFDFWKRFSAAEAMGAVNAATVVYNAAMKDPNYALQWLSRRRPKDWMPRQSQEVTGKDGGPVARTAGRCVWYSRRPMTGVAEIRYRVPAMHPGQRAIYSDPARFKWLSAGRRFRKTTLGMRTSLRAASAGMPILWGAPTYRQCRIAWDEHYRAAGGIAEFCKSQMEIVVPPGNGVISFVSLDAPDNARGKTAYGAILDEAGFIGETAWYEVVRPMLSDCNGWALVMGTPKGRNWFYREHLAAKDAEDSAAWQVPTLGVRIEDDRLVREPHPLENPDFAFAEAVRMFQSMPRRSFEQEFLAQFIEDAGLVFRGVRVVSTAKPQGPTQAPVVFGVDWAKAYDWTVISILDVASRRQVGLERFNQISYEFQAGRLKALYERWRPQMIIAESNSMGEPMIDRLQAEGVPVQGFTTTRQSKAMIIEALALAIERREVTLLDDEIQIAELEGYSMERLPGGSFRYGAVEGMHDDTVMALALAWQGTDQVPPAGALVNDIDSSVYKSQRRTRWA